MKFTKISHLKVTWISGGQIVKNETFWDNLQYGVQLTVGVHSLYVVVEQRNSGLEFNVRFVHHWECRRAGLIQTFDVEQDDEAVGCWLLRLNLIRWTDDIKSFHEKIVNSPLKKQGFAPGRTSSTFETTLTPFLHYFLINKMFLYLMTTTASLWMWCIISNTVCHKITNVCCWACYETNYISQNNLLSSNMFQEDRLDDDLFSVSHWQKQRQLLSNSLPGVFIETGWGEFEMEFDLWATHWINSHAHTRLEIRSTSSPGMRWRGWPGRGAESGSTRTCPWCWSRSGWTCTSLRRGPQPSAQTDGRSHQECSGRLTQVV